VEPAKAVDQVVETVVERHGRGIVAWRLGSSRYRSDTKQGHGATVRDADRFCEAMDTDSQLIDALASDLDGSFEALVLAHQDRIYSIALRMLGDPRDAEEAAQDSFVRAYRALGGYDPTRIRELRLRAWLATIVLNLCRSRIGRRVAAGQRPLSLDAAPPGQMEPVAEEAFGPAAHALRVDAASRWAGLLLTLPPAYRSAVVLRHVDGLSYPEVAAALDRPEGTVKAQVHRGLALLRTAFEAAEGIERQEMTA
jgi:RNA polymerase sigma-70 factor (ECF subfamily)